MGMQQDENEEDETTLGRLHQLRSAQLQRTYAHTYRFTLHIQHAMCRSDRYA